MPHILGYVSIDSEAVHTHRDSYILSSLTVVSVRRPLLAGAFVFASGFGAFGAGFADILYAHEITVIVGGSIGALIAGMWTGQLKLLSRDLRGSELAGAIWGSYRDLNQVRADIVHAIRSAKWDVRS